MDLGAAILLPGLINAHCHLDYTGMTGLPPPRNFPDWIKSLLRPESGGRVTPITPARGWRARPCWRGRGARRWRTSKRCRSCCRRFGPARRCAWRRFLEMTGVKSQRAPAAILGEAAAKIESLKPRRGLAGTFAPRAVFHHRAAAGGDGPAGPPKKLARDDACGGVGGGI